jgi:chromosomal replication initiation ATPase DnaA
MGKATAILDPRAVLKLLGGTSGYKRFIHEARDVGHTEEYYEVADQRFLGDEEFGAELIRNYEDEEPRKRRGLAIVAKELAAAVKIDIEQLQTPSRGRKLSQLRTMIAYALVRQGGYSVKDVAGYFGRDATTISVALSRYDGVINEQPELRRRSAKLARLV